MTASLPIDARRPILLVGLPRSGTTWVGDVLASAPGVHYLFEPDNEKTSPVAWRRKQGLHRFPYLPPGAQCAEFEALWRSVFSRRPLHGGADRFLRRAASRFAPVRELSIGETTGQVHLARDWNNVDPAAALRRRRRFGYRLARRALPALAEAARAATMPGVTIAKSVHAPLCAEWISRRFETRCVVVLRNPFALYASYRRMRMPDALRNVLYQDALRRMLELRMPDLGERERAIGDPIAFQIGLLTRALLWQLERNPGWVRVSHDQLCAGPEARFRALFTALELPWTESTAERIRARNEAGDGFRPDRIAALQPNKWRNELSESERRAVERSIDAFGLGFEGEVVAGEQGR